MRGLNWSAAVWFWNLQLLPQSFVAATAGLGQRQFWLGGNFPSSLQMMNGGCPFAMFLKWEYPQEHKASWIVHVSPQLGALLVLFSFQGFLLRAVGDCLSSFRAFSEYSDYLLLCFAPEGFIDSICFDRRQYRHLSRCDICSHVPDPRCIRYVSACLFCLFELRQRCSKSCPVRRGAGF